jgi:oligoribonuclease (3'-5' exoribonuclease)
MSEQIRDYISLKPIAERFKDVASTISDEEIKSLIKEELREQIHKQVEFGSTIAEWVETMLEGDDMCELVRESMVSSIKNKFK